MIASYPMYNLPSMQQGIADWWQSIAQQLAQTGICLDFQRSIIEKDLYQHWLNPNLLISQTCGYPLTTVLKNKVKLIGTPVYESQYCSDADYCSLFVVRSTDDAESIDNFKGRIFTFNGTDSQSGFNSVRNYLQERDIDTPFFGENKVSGQHINSIASVANGTADICAVDCVTHALVKRYQPHLLENTRILTTTKKTPGLPFITSMNTSDEIIDLVFHAIQKVTQDVSDRNSSTDLLITGIEKISLEKYITMINPPVTKVDEL